MARSGGAAGRDPLPPGGPLLLGLGAWVSLGALDALAVFGGGPPRGWGLGEILWVGLAIAGSAVLPAAVAVVLAVVGGRVLLDWLAARRVPCSPGAGAPAAADLARCRGPAARLLAAGLLLPLFGYGLLRLGVWIQTNLHDPQLGALLWLGGGLLALGLGGGLAVPGGRLLARWLPRAVVEHPGRQALLAALPATLAGLGLAFSSWVGLDRLGEAKPCSPVLVLLLLLLVRVRLAAPAPRGRVLRAGAARLGGRVGTSLLAGGVLLALAAVLVAGARSETRRVVGERSVVAGPCWSLLRTLGDLDRDGFASFLGGGDCAPLDPRRHPEAVEVPGNGLDESCTGSDQLPPPLPTPRWSSLPAGLPTERISVLLLVLDALRADHLGLLGYPRPTSAPIDALAKECVVFTRAYSPSATTRFSLPALLAGRHPSALAWRRQGRSLVPAPGKNLWLQQRLQRAGYHTAAVVSSYDLFRPAFGLAVGFTSYDTERVRFSSERSIEGRTSDQVTAAGRELLAEAEALGRDFFIYLHYMDIHAPYAETGPLPFGRQEVDRYDAEILSTLQEVRRLLDDLRRRPAASRTLVVITADHGDQFGERDRRGHGRFVYDEEVHVPLLLCLPGLTPGTHAAPVSLIDLAPTLANLTGVKEGWSRYQGANLLPLLQGGERPAAVVAETWPFAVYRKRRIARITWPYKTIFNRQDRTWEIYDLQGDPGEMVNLHASLPPAIRGSLQDGLSHWLHLHPLR